MSHIKAIVIKFIATFALLYVILGIVFDVQFENVLLISLVLGVISYMVGDLVILPRTNNRVATLADFGMAFLVIWLMLDNISNDGADIFWASLFSAIGVALFEYFFHKYVASTVDNKQENKSRRNNALQYQTEASEEVTPRIPRNRK
ncbi:YndM family protein [Metabacillus sp. Hm71]|uniref:YndM family protein n=1 Tax=Metabacillus sp. Hm71 TaxID=3450743 RepID=UPI003F43BE34